MKKVILLCMAFSLHSLVGFAQDTNKVNTHEVAATASLISYIDTTSDISIIIRRVICDSVNLKVVIFNNSVRSIGMLKNISSARTRSKDTCLLGVGDNPNDLHEITHTYQSLRIFEIPARDSLVLNIEQIRCEVIDLSVLICVDLTKMKAELEKKKWLYDELLVDGQKSYNIGDLIGRDTNFIAVSFNGISPNCEKVIVKTYR